MNNLTFFTNINNLFPFIKIGFWALDSIFIFFLIVMIKQLYSMNHIVTDSKDFIILKTCSFLLLILAISLFLLGFVIL